MREEERLALARAYQELTGRTVAKFVCPFTLNDDVDAELCDGHIISLSVKKASRATVLQRADVDNRFGSRLEAGFVRLVNFPSLTTRERLAQSRRFSIELPDGTTVQAFHAGSEARDVFPQATILDSQGNPIMAPFMKTALPISGLYRDVKVSSAIVVSEARLTGAAVKMAFLALFKLFPYNYALSPVGNIVRLALCEVVERPSDDPAAFSSLARFDGAILVAMPGSFNTLPDTIAGGTLLFHYSDGDINTGFLFAVSCLFRINDQLVIVTLPANSRLGLELDALTRYGRYLKDRNAPCSVHAGRRRDGVVQINPTPMDLKYVGGSN